jgi:hypothetical protein
MEMTQYKYQFLAIMLAIVIGGLAGYFLASSHTDSEISKIVEERVRTLKEEVEGGKLKIELKLKELQKLDSIHRADSLTVLSLQKKIMQDGVHTEKLRKDAQKLTTSEKQRWLLERYKH